jgi:hypothetical protein
MGEKSIEVTIQPVYLKNGYVYIPIRYTGFFPPGKPKTVKSIQVETDAGVINAQLQYNSKAYI